MWFPGQNGHVPATHVLIDTIPPPKVSSPTHHHPNPCATTHPSRVTHGREVAPRFEAAALTSKAIPQKVRTTAALSRALKRREEFSLFSLLLLPLHVMMPFIFYEFCNSEWPPLLEVVCCGQTFVFLIFRALAVSSFVAAATVRDVGWADMALLQMGETRTRLCIARLHWIVFTYIEANGIESSCCRSCCLAQTRCALLRCGRRALRDLDANVHVLAVDAVAQLLRPVS